MRLAFLVLLGVASLGCTRPNPAFGSDENGSSVGASTGTSTSASTGGPTGEGSADGGNTADGGGSTNAGSVGPGDGMSADGITADGITTDDTTADGSDDGPEPCSLEPIERPPIKDNILLETGICEGNIECRNANFGWLEFALLRELGAAPRGHLLMTFDVSDLESVAMPGAELRLVLENPTGPFQLQVFVVSPPTDWGEGEGYGDLAISEESSWNSSAVRDSWDPPTQEADFSVVLGPATPLGVQPYAPFMGLDEIIYPIPASTVLNEADDQGLLHLVVTNAMGPELVVFTRDEEFLTPLLSLNGC